MWKVEETWLTTCDWGGQLETVLYHKFVQHAGLREMLMATGGADLVFADPDVVWGDGGIGQGLNLLGRALMQVRARLRAEGLDT